ncbi:Putative NACHT nucleoside triphosphatase, P-loop containing nucleoside triphosphate hydrolase [Colletotrichum destructivum]|uniref:NACHT nucleoside triphosphatase, P-loop containing nucleoside triphosphate hydrolase n=1 Tax=Colletotrichum destructivum TaxID=34406 RepID=A0AAX4J3G7_9PEZI|nr:Putative NACHT nucleoside triphosphatase, P-loop containing nucleoside triphosphate hydrolase [Colletotrichum destructivum]
MSDPLLYTIGWICAIVPEFVPARLFLDEEHKDPVSVSKHDSNSYKLGRIGKHNFVIAVLPHGEYGLNSAATVARDMLHTFKNVKNDIRLGDIVVSSPGDGHGGVFQYDVGKSLHSGRFRTTGFLNKPPTALMTALNSLISDIEIKGNWLGDVIKKALRSKTLRQKYGRPDPESDKLFRSEIAYDADKTLTDHDPEDFVKRPKRDEGEDQVIHYGLIASANQVMKNPCKRDALAAEKNVLCFEMEAAGLVNHFPCLVIRGICDYSHSHQNKQWQGYAAMAAAAYAKALVCRLQQSRLEHERRILEIPQVVSLLENVKQGVSEIKTRVDHAILGELSVAAGAEYDTHHNEHDPTCHPKTRIDIIHEIERWASDAAGPRMYWLSGMAGTGKSTIARTVARKFDDMHMLAASFFFKRGEIDRSRASLLFSTIARQLVSHRQELLPFVLEAIRKTDNISSKSTREQFSKLILDPLHKARTGQRGKPKMLLVLDALNECSAEKDIETVVPLLATLVKCEGYDIKVFVKSRPELAIHYAFDRTKGLHEEIQLHRVSQDTISHDTGVFLRDELAQIKKAWNTRYPECSSRHLSVGWPGNDNLEVLVQMTNPLFIFAATACRFIRDHRYGDPDQQLSTLLRASKESGVNDKLGPTYLPALRQFRDGRTGLEKEQMLLRFRQIVGTIILLEESLSIVSIAGLLGVEEREVERVLGLLSSVIDVPRSPDSPVSLFHLSFREFLLGSGAEDFAIECTAAHRQITLGCLDLLSKRQPLR